MNPADRFVDHNGIYLLSHSVGLPVRGAREAAAGYFDAWEHETIHAWPRWLASIDGFRASLATLLGTEAAAICPQSTVSSALTKILGSLRTSTDRPTILLTEDTFPSLGFVCERSGIDVRYIDRRHDATDPSVWRRHITGDIDIVLVTHVQSNTGELLPVADVVEIASRHDAVTIVDVAQSVGVIPIDATEWGADFIVGSCVKWLSGGPGAGWMWVDPGRADRYEPRDVGWFSHTDPFEFDIHHFRYADDAMRFWGGSPTVVPYTIARHSIDTIAAIGVQTIRSHNLDRTDQIIDALGPRVVSPHDRARRSGTCIVEADTAAADALIAAGIEIDQRATGIRVSPHLHVTADDIDTFVRSVT